MSDFEVRLMARMDAKLESLKSELLKWMFLVWVGTMGTGARHREALIATAA